MADIVDDFLQRLVATIPGVPPEASAQLERQMRQEWGGTVPYVRRRISRVQQREIIAASLREGAPLTEGFAKAGVCRRTGYSILGGK